jgi:hypothetical protein
VYYASRDWFETMDNSGGVSVLIVGNRLSVQPSDRGCSLLRCVGRLTWSAPPTVPIYPITCAAWRPTMVGPMPWK